MARYIRTQFNITDHAVLRMRERFPEGKLLPFSTDDDVRLAIDKAITNAIADGQVENFFDNGQPARLVNISAEYDDMYAILKPEAYNRSEFEEGVVTLLTRDLVESNKNTPEHGWVMGSQPGQKMVSMKDKLQDKIGPVIIRKAASKAAETTNTVVPAETKMSLELPNEIPDLHLVLWRTHHRLCNDKKEAMDHVESLLEAGVDPTHVQVLKPDWKPLKKKVSLDFVA